MTLLSNQLGVSILNMKKEIEIERYYNNCPIYFKVPSEKVAPAQRTGFLIYELDLKYQ